MKRTSDKTKSFLRANNSKIIGFVISLITLIFIPLIIDIVYKKGAKINTPLITNFGADDLLSYWSSLLMVLATIYLANIAYKQNSQLNKINNRITSQQIKPIVISEVQTDFTNGLTIYRVFSKRDDYIVNTGWSLNQPTALRSIAIVIKNIGLGPAVNLNIFLHKLVTIRGMDSLSEFPEKNIEDFYGQILFEDYEYLEEGEINNGKWQIYPTCNLAVDGNSRAICLVFYIDETLHDMHNILELNYENVYGEKSQQLIYFSFINGNGHFMPISFVL